MTGRAHILRRWVAPVLVGASLALTACTSPGSVASPSSPPPTDLPPGVHVEVYQNRFDYAERVLEIRVANEGDSDLDLVSAAYTSPHFDSAATYDSGVLIAAGRTIDLRVPLADVVCDGGDSPDAVELTWRVPGGGTASASVKPVDETSVIERIVAEDCVTRSVTDVLRIIPPDVLRVVGIGADSVAWVDVTLQPTGAAGSVSIDYVGSTVLLTSVSGADWPAGITMDASSGIRTVSLDLRPTRCDPHAIAEDKRGTVFPFAVSTSAGFSGTYDLVVSDALRSQIYDWIPARCGAASSP
jgi:hypothetical protein